MTEIVRQFVVVAANMRQLGARTWAAGLAKIINIANYESGRSGV